MSSKADRLGRGAAFGSASPVSARRAAIAAATGAPTDGVVPHQLPIEAISQNPDNPRESLRGIEEMADTFSTVGQITAITVATVHAYLEERPGRAGELDPDTKYVVVDGHRRLAAARSLGWQQIRVMVDDAQVSSDQRLLEAAFIANTQRDNMTEIEQATALKKLVDFYGSQGKAAKHLGKTQAFISQRLSLLSLSPELQADLNTGARQVKHVRNLASLPEQEQKAKADARAAAETEARSRRPPRAASARTHNPVMGSAGGEVPTATHNPVMGPGGTTAQHTRLGEADTAAPALDLPAGFWSDPEAVAQHLIETFGFDDRRLISIRLLNHNHKERPDADPTALA